MLSLIETVPPAGRNTVPGNMVMLRGPGPVTVIFVMVTFPEKLQRLVIVLLTKPTLGAEVPFEDRVSFEGIALMVKSGVQPPVVVGVPVTMKDKS